MSDPLLAWYERELEFLRSGRHKFANEHPQLASDLGESYDKAPDPHVSRFIESFALLNAQLSRQLSEDSAQIPSNLLQILSPLVLQSLPSASLLHVSPSRDSFSVTTLPSGTRFRAYIDDDRFCEFHTTSDLQLCPFDIVRSAMHFRPFSPDLSMNGQWVSEQASAVLSIDLAMLDKAFSFNQLPDFPELTFHFQGLPRHLAQLYDFLFYNRHSVALMDDRGMQVSIPESCFRPVGMEDRERMITHENLTFVMFQVLMEVFAWPELFYGFRLLDFGQYLRQFAGNRVSLLIFFEDVSEEAIFSMADIEVKLGCAPLINLFDLIAEPIVADHRQLDYPLIPDSQNLNQLEIQSVKSVMDVTGEKPAVIPQLCCMKHYDIGCDTFWIYNAPYQESDENGRIGLVCPDLDPNQNQIKVLSPHLVCSNGNQVLEISDFPRLECLDSIEIPGEVRMLIRPTRYIRRPTNKNFFNLLVSLKTGFLSALQEKNAAASVRTIFQLYFFNNNAYGRAWIDSIINVSIVPMVAPIRIGSYKCVTQGVEVIYELDPDKLKQSGLMMFVNVLDYIMTGYAGYHSFLQLIVRLKGKPGDHVRCTRHHGYRMKR